MKNITQDIAWRGQNVKLEKFKACCGMIICAHQHIILRMKLFRTGNKVMLWHEFMHTIDLDSDMHLNTNFEPHKYP